MSGDCEKRRNMKYIIVSDIHLDHKDPNYGAEFDQVLADSNAQNLIIVGDVTCTASEDEYHITSTWLSGLRQRGINIILTVGNHDVAVPFLPKVTRLFLEEGYRRFGKLVDDLVVRQPIVIARDGIDVVYAVERDVFFSVRTTHHRLDFLGSERVSREQLEWARAVAMRNGISVRAGYRLHLLTHHSLFKGHHRPMHERTRLVEELLQPLSFSTSINGHNHGFCHGREEIRKTGFEIYHIQAPTLNPHKDKHGRGDVGYVSWDSELPESAVFEAHKRKA